MHLTSWEVKRAFFIKTQVSSHPKTPFPKGSFHVFSCGFPAARHGYRKNPSVANASCRRFGTLRKLAWATWATLGHLVSADLVSLCASKKRDDYHRDINFPWHVFFFSVVTINSYYRWIQVFRHEFCDIPYLQELLRAASSGFFVSIHDFGAVTKKPVMLAESGECEIMQHVRPKTQADECN